MNEVALPRPTHHYLDSVPDGRYSRRDGYVRYGNMETFAPTNEIEIGFQTGSETGCVPHPLLDGGSPLLVLEAESPTADLLVHLVLE